VIEAVLENMRKNLEPLKYSTLVPSRYLSPSAFGKNSTDGLQNVDVQMEVARVPIRGKNLLPLRERQDARRLWSRRELRVGNVQADAVVHVIFNSILSCAPILSPLTFVLYASG
jgi:hypothetical protein